MAKSSFETPRFYPDPQDPSIQRPSVTTILQALAKPALVPWAAGATAREALAGVGRDDPIADWAAMYRLTSKTKEQDDREAARKWLAGASTRSRDVAADLGTFVHLCADALAQDQPLPTIPDGMSQGELEQFIEQFERWRKGFGITYVASEVEVHHPMWGYAGRFDGIVEVPDGTRYLMDLKTGKEIADKRTGRIYDAIIYQLAAYGHARQWVMGEWMPLHFDEYAVLHLRPDRVEWLRVPVTEFDFSAFLAAAKVWESLQNHKDGVAYNGSLLLPTREAVA